MTLKQWCEKQGCSSVLDEVDGALKVRATYRYESGNDGSGMEYDTDMIGLALLTNGIVVVDWCGDESYGLEGRRRVNPPVQRIRENGCTFRLHRTYA